MKKRKNSLNIEKRVISLEDSDASWNWSSSCCSFEIKTPNSLYATSINCDPFPCYSHPRELVIQIAKETEETFPIGFPTFYYLLPFEEITRTNGNARKIVNYETEDFEGMIILSGKRICIHPAMTRYLVAHEYGHIVDNWLCFKKNLEPDGLDAEYAKMRNVPFNQEYGGRKWHTNIGEIIANDFRIVVARIETEFFPHPCKHPLEDDNVIDWWMKNLKKYSQRFNN